MGKLYHTSFLPKLRDCFGRQGGKTVRPEAVDDFKKATVFVHNTTVTR